MDWTSIRLSYDNGVLCDLGEQNIKLVMNNGNLLPSQVSWVRRRNGDVDVDLLTVGLEAYSMDRRFSLEFIEPNNWRLTIRSVSLRDSGTYICEVSSHPPMELSFHVQIVGKSIFSSKK